MSVPEGAFDFGSADCAIEFVLGSQLAGTRVALQFTTAPEVLWIYPLPTEPLALQRLKIALHGVNDHAQACNAASLLKSMLPQRSVAGGVDPADLHPQT